MSVITSSTPLSHQCWTWRRRIQHRETSGSASVTGITASLFHATTVQALARAFGQVHDDADHNSPPSDGLILTSFGHVHDDADHKSAPSDGLITQPCEVSKLNPKAASLNNHAAMMLLSVRQGDLAERLRRRLGPHQRIPGRGGSCAPLKSRHRDDDASRHLSWSAGRTWYLLRARRALASYQHGSMQLHHHSGDESRGGILC